MTGPPIPGVTRAEVLARLNDPSLTLVNVLPRATFEDGHIPRSINMPLAELEGRAPREIPDRGGDVVVYCASPT